MMTPEQYKSIEERAVKYLEDNGVRVSRITTYEHGAEFGFHLRDEEVERLKYALQNAILTRDNHWAELDTLKKQVEELKVWEIRAGELHSAKHEMTVKFLDLLRRINPYIQDLENTHDPSVGLHADKELDALQKELATYITDKQ